MLASVAQAPIMLSCLFFYGDSRPWFAYPLIAYSILMILPQLPERAGRGSTQTGGPVDPDRRLHMANEGSVDATAEELLRRFEPVIRSLKANGLLPDGPEPHVDACSLGSRAPTRTPSAWFRRRAHPERLAQQPEDTTGAVHYLKIPNPKESENGGRRARRSHTNPRLAQGDFPGRQGPPRAPATSRGWRMRSFSLTLLARGRVPGGDVEGAASCTAASWRRDNASRITVTWFARTVGSCCGTGSSRFQ